MKTYLEINQVVELYNCCGVHDVGQFEAIEVQDSFVARYTPQILSPSGTGMFVSTFTNEPECKLAYTTLCKEHKLLYQSAPRMNDKSGNKLFLCVFLHKDKKDRKKESYTGRPGEKLPAFMGRS